MIGTTKAFYEMPLLDSAFTVRIDRDELLRIIRNDSTFNVDKITEEIQDWYVRDMLHRLMCDYVLTKEYKKILTDDAHRRMVDDGVTEFNEMLRLWYKDRNADHWLDGEPIRHGAPLVGTLRPDDDF